MAGFTFAKPSGGATYFKPAEHMSDLALMVEAKEIRKNVPHTYQGRQSLRDEVIADVTVFATSESLDKGQPTKVMKDVKFTHVMLTSELERNIGVPLLGVIRRIPTSGGSGYAFRPVDEATESKVAAYYEAREAVVAEALANVPSFD